MNRRHFIAGAVAAMAAPKSLMASGSAWSIYTPGLIEQKLAAGETVFVDFSATWCSTCARQERVIAELRAQNPDFDANISFVKVDWDDFRKHDVTVSRKIPRRSTLVLLKGDEELGRIVAGTKAEEINKLLELGIAAS